MAKIFKPRPESPRFKPMRHFHEAWVLTISHPKTLIDEDVFFLQLGQGEGAQVLRFTSTTGPVVLQAIDSLLEKTREFLLEHLEP